MREIIDNPIQATSAKVLIAFLSSPTYFQLKLYLHPSLQLNPQHFAFKRDKNEISYDALPLGNVQAETDLSLGYSTLGETTLVLFSHDISFRLTRRMNSPSSASFFRLRSNTRHSLGPNISELLLPVHRSHTYLSCSFLLVTLFFILQDIEKAESKAEIATLAHASLQEAANLALKRRYAEARERIFLVLLGG